MSKRPAYYPPCPTQVGRDDCHYLRAAAVKGVGF
jgi:hypothetical protein